MTHSNVHRISEVLE